MTRAIGFRIYQHNIRYATTRPFKGEVLWDERKYLTIKSIRFHARFHSVVCLEEVLKNQLDDIMEGLGSDWTYVGKGRDDGKEAGEFNVIVFNKHEWKLLDSHVYWLSPTPEKPSRGWDAALNRIVVHAYLEQRHSGARTHIFCTHFDHMGVEARRESAKLILGLIEKHANGGPAFVVGDLNSPASEDAYKTLAHRLQDAAHAPAEPDRYGHHQTYTGFNDSEPQTIIDYIFGTKDTHIESYGVLHTRFGGITFSDHRPVVADVCHRSSE